MNIAHTTPKARQRGVLYPELMVYMALLLMFSALAYTAFTRAQHRAADIQRQSMEMTTALRVGERWRADVRQATAAPEWIPSAWRKAMVMRLATPEGPVDYFFEGGQVWRKVGDAPREEILSSVQHSEMIMDSRGTVAVVRWELELTPSAGRRARTRPLFTFLAVPNYTVPQLQP